MIEWQRVVMKYGGTLKPGPRTTIPNHPGDIPQGTIRAILRQARIDVNAFLKL